MKKYRNIASVLLFSAVLFSLAVFAWVKAPAGYSSAERRTLAQLPKLSLSELGSGMYMSKFDSYSMDQFPMRDGFRSFKAACVKNIFGQKDNNGLYSINGYLSKLDYPLNEARIDASLAKINAVVEKYLADTDCRVYLSLIPDKNIFLAPLGGYPCIDFAALEKRFTGAVPHDAYIDIYGLLSLEDFYYSDQHWRQECIRDAALRVGDAMNTPAVETDFEEIILNRDFYGAYAGQSALPAKADTVRYLTNSILDNCIVTDYSTGSPSESSIYSLEKGFGRDPYELFLNGSTPLIVIENPASQTDRELVVFRDSFGSSLIPLLAPRYAKITAVDLRYIRSDMLGRFISFDRQDVLFMYSTLILNNVLSM